jgi:fermentation-respiration switch protein FrsA (DUF1100 family)
MIMKAVLTLVVVLVAAALLVRFAESRLAFFPTVGETITPQHFDVVFQAVTIATADGERLHGWLMATPSPRAHVLYFHGNGGNLSVWAPVLTGLVRQGYAVFAFDYRGYGRSTGRPTEQGLYRDAEAAVTRFWADVPQDAPVVYWGRSLGGALATYAATVRAPSGIVLEASFPDVGTLVRSSPVMAVLGLFSTYRFPAARYLEHERVKSTPVLVMHGDSDRVIPFELGRALYERVSGPKRFVTIQGGDHNDAVPADPTGYWNAVGTFVNGLRGPA